MNQNQLPYKWHIDLRGLDRPKIVLELNPAVKSAGHRAGIITIEQICQQMGSSKTKTLQVPASAAS
jgi:hypothetical protein